ncbi:GntR family transcriptional regulator [Pseudonocardia sp. Ae717_Ps2]|uniref:GntR family transcriptional regulator n=1 Tax=Pseudonocardia sp. Ae717_Ps2 TaxID=1885573 RepID=UPI0018E99917
MARELRERITNGTYPPGSTLPALPELMATYEVARETVRSAVSALANEGLVTPLSGVGTVVARPRHRGHAQPARRRASRVGEHHRGMTQRSRPSRRPTTSRTTK